MPFNLEAEEAVVGSMMIDFTAIGRIRTFLEPEDFHRVKHQLIVRAIYDLHTNNEPVDPVILTDLLERRQQMGDVGGPAGVMELFTRVPTAIHIEYYARIVERNSVLRRMIAACETIAVNAHNATDQPLSQLIGDAEAEFFRLNARHRKGGLQLIGHVLEEYYEEATNMVVGNSSVMGVPTGFTDLDRLLGGLQAGDLIVLGARPSMGKTALGLAIGENSSLQGARVAFFSLEMGNQQLGQRVLAGRTGIDHQRLRTGPMTEADLELITEEIEKLSKTYLMFDETSSLTPGELRSKLHRAIGTVGLDLVIVDYLQLMSAGRRTYDDGGGENRQQEVAYISRELKGLARELKVPVLALCQLSRKVEERADKRPLLADLRESGQLEQDADVVMFIYRDEVYNKKTQSPNVAEIIVAKHRNGPVGTVNLRFVRESAQFRNLETYSGPAMEEMRGNSGEIPTDDIIF